MIISSTAKTPWTQSLIPYSVFRPDTHIGPGISLDSLKSAMYLIKIIYPPLWLTTLTGVSSSLETGAPSTQAFNGGGIKHKMRLSYYINIYRIEIFEANGPDEFMDHPTGEECYVWKGA